MVFAVAKALVVQLAMAVDLRRDQFAVIYGERALKVLPQDAMVMAAVVAMKRMEMSTKLLHPTQVISLYLLRSVWRAVLYLMN